MLEINFFQENNESLVNQSEKFSLTQIKNGNYVLSNFTDHYRLKYVLFGWEKSTIGNFEEDYKKFLESNKKIQENTKLKNTFLEEKLPQSKSKVVQYPLALEKKIGKDFTKILKIQDGQSQFSFSDNMITKYPDNNQIFIGCSNGSLQEYSLNEQKIVHQFGEILNEEIYSMAKTFDNKSLFVCHCNGGFAEVDIFTRKLVKNFEVQNARCCVVTHDNQFLITVQKGDYNVNLTKWSIQTKQQLHTWNSLVNQDVTSQNCSYDSKYQFILFKNGCLSIFDLQKQKTLVQYVTINSEAVSNLITSVAFTQDNQSAYISDFCGNIQIIKWKINASSENDFDFSQNYKAIGNHHTNEICLTKDDKNLLVGSQRLVSVFNTETKEVIKQFGMDNNVKGVKLIKDGKNALIAEKNGSLSIINLETFEISPIHGNITEKPILTKILVI